MPWENKFLEELDSQEGEFDLQKGQFVNADNASNISPISSVFLRINRNAAFPPGY